MTRVMSDREFIVWLSGYVDAKPDGVDDVVRAQLNAQVVSVIRNKMLEAIGPGPVYASPGKMVNPGPLTPPWSNPIASSGGTPGMRAVGSSLAATATPGAVAGMTSVGHTTVGEPRDLAGE